MIARAVACRRRSRPAHRRVTAVRGQLSRACRPTGGSLLFGSNRTGADSRSGPPLRTGRTRRPFFDGRQLGTGPGSPVWSPDGRSIVFAMRPAARRTRTSQDIYVMRSDGTRRPPPDARRPAMIRIPIGRRTADASFSTRRARRRIIKAGLEPAMASTSTAWPPTEATSAATPTARASAPIPCRRPTAGFIAYRKIIDTLGHELGPDRRPAQFGSVRHRNRWLERRSTSANTRAYDGWPMWSPDGRWIVFASNRDKLANTGQIYAVRPDGTELRRLTTRLHFPRPAQLQRRRQATVCLRRMSKLPNFTLGHIASIRVALARLIDVA